MALCQFILTTDMVVSPGFPLLSLSSPPLLGAVVSCQCLFCSEMLWGGGSDTWHWGEGRGPDYIALLDAPMMVFFPFLLYMNIKSYTPYLCMYSYNCSCSFKLFYMALQVNFSRPHKVSLSFISPSPFAFFFLLFFPFHYHQGV